MPHTLAEEVAADARRHVLGACSAYGPVGPTTTNSTATTTFLR